MKKLFERLMVVAHDVLPYGWYHWESETTLANEASESTLSCKCLGQRGIPLHGRENLGHTFPRICLLAAKCLAFLFGQ